MTLLSRKADYALLILSYLHRNPDGGCARAIADRFELSRPFVKNILKKLCLKGFVASHRGVNGGYTLSRPAGEISLAELLESLDDGFRLATCSNEAKPAPANDGCSLLSVCPMHGPIAELHRRINDLLRTVTLADLFRPSATTYETTFQPVLATLGNREACASGLGS